MLQNTLTAMLETAQNHPTFTLLVVVITALLLGLAVDRWYDARIARNREALRSRTITDSQRQDDLRRAANRQAPWQG